MWLVTRAEGHGEASLTLAKVSIEISRCKSLSRDYQDLCDS